MDPSPHHRPAIAGGACLICGYRLVGLDPAGLCPECGTPVERSVSGDLLSASDPAFVAALHRGARLAAMAPIVPCLTLPFLLLAPLALGHPASAPVGITSLLARGILLASLAGVLTGWWWLCTPDPQAPREPRTSDARFWMRTGVVVIAAAALLRLLSGAILPFVVAQPVPPLDGAIILIALAAAITCFFASLLLLRRLAVRLPSPRLHRSARRMLWLGPLLAVPGAACALLGPVVAIVLYWSLLYETWDKLAALRRDQNHPSGGKPSPPEAGHRTW